MSAVLKSSNDIPHTGHRLLVVPIRVAVALAKPFVSMLPGLKMSRCSMFTCSSRSVDDSNVRVQIGQPNAFNVSTCELFDEVTDGLSGSKWARFICSSNIVAFPDAYGQIGHWKIDFPQGFSVGSQSAEAFCSHNSLEILPLAFGLKALAPLNLNLAETVMVTSALHSSDQWRCIGFRHRCVVRSIFPHRRPSFPYQSVVDSSPVDCIDYV